MEKIEITLLFFGSLKQHFNNTAILSVNLGKTVSEILKELVAQNPETQKLFDICQFAVDSNIVDTNFMITRKCELAILPPFSGG